MTDKVRKLIQAQINMAEDNLIRANAAAKRYGPTKEWGESGRTLDQLIRGYQEAKRQWEQEL